MGFPSDERSRGKASACPELWLRGAVGCTWPTHEICSDQIVSLHTRLGMGTEQQQSH